MSAENVEMLSRYLWLDKVNTIEDYLDPEYYNKLLKMYSFNGMTDLDIFKSFLDESQASNVLELGCGSGRASDIAIRALPNARFTFSDLSNRMILHTKERLQRKVKADFIVEDAVELLIKSKDQYDLVYTLWSFSHSTHQHIHKLGFEKASQMLSSSLSKFIRENMVSGGRFFMIHFDSMSEEQRILMQQWKQVLPEFSDTNRQSPSKRIIDYVLTDMDNSNEIILSVSHLRGDPIVYASQSELLETFVNFHLETYFNESPLLPKILKSIKKLSDGYRQDDGSYAIIPGCYIYSFEKI